MERDEPQTLLPVATELVGSRPAYKGYFPLWYSVSLAAVKILGATYVQAPLFNGSSYDGMNSEPRRGSLRWTYLAPQNIGLRIFIEVGGYLHHNSE